MSVFESKRKRYGTDLQLIGGYFPREVVERFGLVAIAKGETRSGLLKEHIETLLDEEPDNDTLILDIASSAYKEWKKRLVQNEGKSKWKTNKQLMSRYTDFKKEVEVKLRLKKLSEKHIAAVIYKMGHISLPIDDTENNETE